jgi:hypothetical protein
MNTDDRTLLGLCFAIVVITATMVWIQYVPLANAWVMSTCAALFAGMAFSRIFR